MKTSMVEEIKFYQERGFCVSQPFFDDAEIKIACKAIQRLEKRVLIDKQSNIASHCVLESELPAAKRNGRQLSSTENALFIFNDPILFEPILIGLCIKENLVQLVQQLLGTESIVFHFVNITSKSPLIGSGINWHRDFPNQYISPVEPRMVRTMICLDGMVADNGPTSFAIKSHLDGFEKKPKAEEEVYALCDPGSVVAIHPLVLHGGPPNASSNPRRNIVIQWGRKDTPLTKNSVRETLTECSVGDAKKLLLQMINA